MEIFKSGSKGVGVAEMITGVIGVGLGGYNGTRSFLNAAKEFGKKGVLEDWTNVPTLAVHEFTMGIGSFAGNAISLIPKDWWIGEGYNHLSAGNMSMIVAAAAGAFAVKGFGDFSRGVDDMGGRSR